MRDGAWAGEESFQDNRQALAMGMEGKGEAVLGRAPRFGLVK